jgi:hypothetical protein
MADPFSVTGTAVGITSLGIQACQILLNYYSKFKNIHNDMDDLLRRVEGLQGILNSPKGLEERIEIHIYEPQVNLSLIACEKLLHQLKNLADKCNATPGSGSFQDRLRYATKRTIWPFKQETVKELHQTLNSFQHNLSLALQSAGLDAIVRKLNDLSPKLDTLLGQTTTIQDYVGQQTIALRSIQHNITSSSLDQEQHSGAVLRELSCIRTELSGSIASVQQGLSLLV